MEEVYDVLVSCEQYIIAGVVIIGLTSPTSKACIILSFLAPNLVCTNLVSVATRKRVE